jgi:hypothetical protein
MSQDFTFTSHTVCDLAIVSSGGWLNSFEDSFSDLLTNIIARPSDSGFYPQHLAPILPSRANPPQAFVLGQI